MPITKNALPILEYDTERKALLDPVHENLDLHLPEKCLFPFLHGEVEKYARAKGLKVTGTFVSSTRHFPVYIDVINNEPICLCDAPVGSSAAGQFLDWLIGYGVKKIISAGSCGTLNFFPENTFLVPVKALRDEGTSYHYLPPERFITLNTEAVSAIQRTLKEEGLPCKNVTTWTTDGFFRETPDMVSYRKEEGCDVVEMEISALAAISAFRGVTYGHLLFTADALSGLAHEDRSFGKASRSPALVLCQKILENM